MRSLRTCIVLLISLLPVRWTAGGDPLDDKALHRGQQLLTDFLVDMEEFGDQPLLYQGTVVVVDGDPSDGIYPFIAFRAVDDRGMRRFWEIRHPLSTLPRIGMGDGYADLTFPDGRRWYSNMRGGPRLAPPPVADQVDRHIRIDPRVGVLVYPGGLTAGRGVMGASAYSWARSDQLIACLDNPDHAMCVFESPVTNDWIHLVFDRKQGWRPVLCYITPATASFDDAPRNRSYANTVMQVRWERRVDGTWVPIAGSNVDYHTKTSADYDNLYQVEYRVHYLSKNDLPPNCFEIAGLSSDPAIMVAEVAPALKDLQNVEPFDNR